jgi:cysteine desulfurase family protein (TIGR01976 family)
MGSAMPRSGSPSSVEFDVARVREQFPGLDRRWRGASVVHFDGPAGSQVPRCVIDAVAETLAHCNANTHGRFPTSREIDERLARARAAAADLFGVDDDSCVVFGPNMTSLTFALGRAMARTWKPGDEVVVTNLDHDANITPWVLAARDSGATVRQVSISRRDTSLDMVDLATKIGPRTRLVAVTAASNATGTKTPLSAISRMVHDAGALLFVDAVHYAPHELIDVAAWDCDFAVCSAYKFCGPHAGILWGRRDAMEALPAYRVRPVGDALPDRWMMGTANHEGIAGTLAAIDYLAGLGRGDGRRAALASAYRAIVDHEGALLDRLLAGLAGIGDVRVWGIADRKRRTERVPTVAITHARLSPAAIAERLGERGIFVWDGNYYAVEVTRSLGLEPGGMVRIGILHYNTADEVDRLLQELGSL